MYAINKHDMKPELNIENSEKILNSTCLRMFKLDDAVVQDEQKQVITEVSSDMFENSFRNLNGVFKTLKPIETI